jgi:hypothetical protein
VASAIKKTSAQEKGSDWRRVAAFWGGSSLKSGSLNHKRRLDSREKPPKGLAQGRIGDGIMIFFVLNFFKLWQRYIKTLTTQVRPLPEDEFILAHGFKRFQSRVAWPCCLVVTQDVMARAHVRGSCSPHGSQEAKREKGQTKVPVSPSRECSNNLTSSL